MESANHITKNLNSRKLLIISIILYVISCFYFLSYYQYDMNYWDEGVPLNGALRMLHGERPVRDFLAYPPGRYIVYFLSMKVGGIHVSSPRIAMSFLTSLVAVLIWILGVRIGLKKTAFIPWLLYLFAPMFYFYRFFTISLIFMALCLDMVLKPMNGKRAVVSGIFSVLIVWLRLELSMILLVILAIIPFFKSYHLKQKINMLSFMPLVIMILGKISLIIYVGGYTSWLNYLRISSAITSTGLKDMGLPWPPLYSIEYLQSINVFHFFQDSMFYASVCILILGAVALIKNGFKNTTLIAVFATALVGFGLVFWRTGYGNLLRALPPVVVLATYLITRKTRYFQLQVLSGLIVFSVLTADAILVNPETYQSIGVKRTITETQFIHPRFKANTTSHDCRVSSDIVSLLEYLKSENYSTMSIFPFHPIFNFITDYRLNSYFEWLLPGMQNDERLKNMIVQDIKKNASDIIVVNDFPIDGYDSRRFTYLYPEVMNWIYNDYYRWEHVSGFDIYLKKSPDMSIVDEKTQNLVSYASGVNTLYQPSGMLIPGKSVYQQCNSSIQFVVEDISDRIFYSVVKLETNTDILHAPIQVAVYVNDIKAFYYTLDKQKTSAICVFPFNVTNGPVNLELITDCTLNQEINAVIWMNPVLLEWKASGLTIDRYCMIK